MTSPRLATDPTKTLTTPTLAGAPTTSFDWLRSRRANSYKTQRSRPRRSRNKRGAKQTGCEATRPARAMPSRPVAPHRLINFAPSCVTRFRLQVEKAKAEADSLIAAARRQAESIRREADHEAQATRQNAYLDTENLRRTVEREAAEARSKVANEREQAIAQLKVTHDEAQQKTAALLAEATKYHSESAERLEADLGEAARIRAEALVEAEQTKNAAAQEAEARIATAKKQAAAINERTQQEFAWRKQQLRRETELLHQRKQAVLSQLASLSALAEQTASAFPDLDDPSDLENGEIGDRTVMRPDMLPPAGVGEDSSAGNKGRPSPRNGGKPDDGHELEIDGDATVLVSPSDLAGEGAKPK